MPNLLEGKTRRAIHSYEKEKPTLLLKGPWTMMMAEKREEWMEDEG